MRGALQRLAATAADLCWPRTCPVEECGRPGDRPGRHLCSRCFAALPWLDDAGALCRVCGARLPSSPGADFICQACLETHPAYEAARSALSYDAPADALIKNFKFNGATYLAEDLVDLLEGAVKANFPDAADVDVVVPVPLHPRRRRQRGYNQCELLSRPLAARLRRRCDTTSLARIRDTPHQSTSNEKERGRNLADAFKVTAPEWIRARTVLLVDDVMTTGATLSACARVLREAGAKRVLCATIARSLREHL